MRKKGKANESRAVGDQRDTGIGRMEIRGRKMRVKENTVGTEGDASEMTQRKDYAGRREIVAAEVS